LLNYNQSSELIAIQISKHSLVRTIRVGDKEAGVGRGENLPYFQIEIASVLNLIQMFLINDNFVFSALLHP